MIFSFFVLFEVVKRSVGARAGAGGAAGGEDPPPPPRPPVPRHIPPKFHSQYSLYTYNNNDIYLSIKYILVDMSVRNDVLR